MRIAISALVLVFSLFLSTVQRAYAENTTASRQKIEQLIEKFKQTIINKDIAGFMKLFLREDITWTGVYTDGSVERYNSKLKDPNAPKSQKFENTGPRRFIESIAKAK